MLATFLWLIVVVLNGVIIIDDDRGKLWNLFFVIVGSMQIASHLFLK